MKMIIGSSSFGYSNNTTNNISKGINALSSGSKASSGLINPSDLAIIERMTSKILGSDMAKSNINYGISFLQTAEGGISEQQQILQDVRELSVQAGNGTLSASDRDAINNQASQLMEEYNEISLGTTFNGKSLLDGSEMNVKLQTGPDSGDISIINLADTRLATQGLDTLDLSTQEGAGLALDSIDSALENLSSSRAEIGTYKSVMGSKMENLTQGNMNASEARARMQDTDYAKTISELIKDQMLEQAQIAMQVHSRNISSELTMSLLR